MTVPPEGNNSGGTYVVTETQNIAITCFNDTANKPCPGGNTTNSVTATGWGGYSGNSFHACNPRYDNGPVEQSPTTAIDPSYFVAGHNFIGWDATSGSCKENPLHSEALSRCSTMLCPQTTGGGGCTICPITKPASCCTCPCGSPIILDINGKGYNLTSAQDGVMFDIVGDGTPWKMAWTAQNSDNAFLALPGPDGLVHNGKELFGNFTPQPTSSTPNGFAALAVYDDPKNGGNGDGLIDARDAIFSSLRLWVDANHDGLCQANELFSLPALGVNSISLKYHQDDKTDQYGNVFRYRAHLNPDKSTDAGKAAYDVFFQIMPPTAAQAAARAKSCPVPKAGK
jgi:hypothetical protein